MIDRNAKKGKLNWLNGLSIFSLFLLVSVSSVGFAYGHLKEGLSFNALKAVRVLFLVTGTAMAVYSLSVVGYSAGAMVVKSLELKVPKRDALVIRLATGLMAISLLL